MSLRVFAWDANPAIDAFLYRQSDNRAQEIVASGRGDFITLPDGRRAIQLRPTPDERIEKVAGTSNLVPFGRVYNKSIAPPSLHYEIPHAGDCRSICSRRYGLRRNKDGQLIRRVIRVSAKRAVLEAALRSLSNTPISA